jgi:hypothetical protein
MIILRIKISNDYKGSVFILYDCFSLIQKRLVYYFIKFRLRIEH